jgi:Fe2+ transport system protein FeoA
MAPPDRPPVAPPGLSAIPLTSVAVGRSARLHEVRDVDSRPHLRALGLTDACELRLCKTGDPCIVQVRTTRIGLSRSVADRLFVVTDDSPSQ